MGHGTCTGVNFGGLHTLRDDMFHLLCQGLVRFSLAFAFSIFEVTIFRKIIIAQQRLSEQGRLIVQEETNCNSEDRQPPSPSIRPMKTLHQLSAYING